MMKDIRSVAQRAAITLTLVSMAALIGCGGGGGGGGVGTTTGPIVQGAPATVILRNVRIPRIVITQIAAS